MEEYEPFGPEWEKEMMKLNKAQLIAMVKSANKPDILAEKHKGMKVDHSGVLGRIADGCKVRPDQRFILGEMDKHLEEMARRFYNGDIKVVDEFLQTYCLDDHRPGSREF